MVVLGISLYWIGMQKVVESVEIPIWIKEAIGRESVDMSTGFFAIEDFIGKNNLNKKFESHFGFKPLSNWLNFTIYTGVSNEFKWHNEKGKGVGDKVGNHNGNNVTIIWISGSEEHGGGLSYLDNDNMILKQPFKENKKITIGSDILHMVEIYSSFDKIRISLNTTWNE